MFAKLLVLTVALVAIAATLLLWRQQRLELTYAVMDTNRQVRQVQQAIWQQESDAARLLAPHRLIEGIDRRRIALEPTKPLRGSMPQTRIVDANDSPQTDAVPFTRTRHLP